jgi:hypothetical protein
MTRSTACTGGTLAQKFGVDEQHNIKRGKGNQVIAAEFGTNIYKKLTGDPAKACDPARIEALK